MKHFHVKVMVGLRHGTQGPETKVANFEGQQALGKTNICKNSITCFPKVLGGTLRTILF